MSAALIVERDPDLRLVLTELLAIEGYVVDACDDSHQACTHVATTRYDLAIVDYDDGAANALLDVLSDSASSPVVVLLAVGPEARRLAERYDIALASRHLELEEVMAIADLARQMRRTPRRPSACSGVRALCW